MNSDMVKSEKFGHFHLVYHFTVPIKHRVCKKVLFFDLQNYLETTDSSLNKKHCHQYLLN